MLPVHSSPCSTGRRPLIRIIAICCFVSAPLLPLGCGHPNEENIRLRKVNQDLQEQVTRLTTENDARQRQINGLLQRSPTVPTLSSDELKKLWITGGLKIGRFSSGLDLDPKKPGDEAIRIFVSPTDEEGNAIQAAGSFVIEAFDLAEPGDNRIGRWTWDVVAAKKEWRTFLLDSTYQLTCPWQQLPKHADITVRVVFTDELTHASFNAEKVIQVKLPPASAAPQGAIPAAATTTSQPAAPPATSQAPAPTKSHAP